MNLPGALQKSSIQVNSTGATRICTILTWLRGILKDDADERLAIIGILHDIIEDTVCTADTLIALFEDKIVEAVIAMTKRQDQTREEYLERVKSNPLAKKVKLVDSMCNMRESILRGDMKRVKKYADQIAFLAG